MAGSSGQPTQGWLPFSASKANLNFATRTVDSAQLGMGYLEGNQTQNAYVEWDVWLDAGTWKYAHTALDYTDSGIYTVQLDGVTVGTIDGYNAVLTRNVYKEITGIAVATSKVYTLKILMATKNASSSNYGPRLSSIALIKTAGAHSTPAGSDTPGYTWMYLPWMGSKANSNWDNRSQSSAQMGGGVLAVSTFATTNYVEWDIWLDAGTYKCAVIGETDTDKAILSLSLDGGSSTIGTVDFYAASSVLNVYKEATGLVVASAGVKTFRMTTATKNASSSNYSAKVNSIAWIRTGA